MRLAVLRETASLAEAYYRPYTDRKDRLIDRPVGLLKEIQARVQENLLTDVPLPEMLHGGVSGKSPFTNASAHGGSSVVLRIDVRKFYPHVTSEHVFLVWRTLGCSFDVSRLLTRLTTRRGHLPVGAPTSTTLANLVLRDVDATVDEWAARCRLSFTRYVDDIIVAGDNPDVLIPLVVAALCKHGFRVAHKKTKIMRSHQQQVVTGLVVNGSMEPRVAQSRIANLRAEIHAASFLDGLQRRKAEDRIGSTLAWLKTTNPAAAKRLERSRARNLR
jgi:hypothetical protein